MKNLIPVLALLLSCASFAQERYLIRVNPDPVVVTVGETVTPEVKVFNSANQEIEEVMIQWQAFETPSVLRGSGLVPSSGAEIDTLGTIRGNNPGEYSVPITAGNSEGFGFAFLQVHVTNAEAAEINIKGIPSDLFSGTTVKLDLSVLDKQGFELGISEVQFKVKNEGLASVDPFQNLIIKKAGKTELDISSGSISNTIKLDIKENPVERIELAPIPSQVFTGDVIQLKASLKNSSGGTVSDIPVQFSFLGQQSISASGAGGIILKDGRFVAENPGVYTLIARTGNASAQTSVEVFQRDVERPIRLIGQGSITSKNTSDFWIWEGVDGNDYAVTGTWGADGTAYFWEVTNPAAIILLDSIQVDARTVNDVKISEDGRVCVISREGASNRKNGIVIIDVTNPRDVKELSTYTENLTGGVHNVFIYEQHVYALSNGQKYEIINIEDPANPKRVGKFEIENPARAIHDVWIEDGIAYSSNWNDGVVMVDIGNGIAGGSPSNPIEIGRFKVEGDANHAAFPFTSKSTGKKYIIAGDEIFPRSFITNPNAVFQPSGYLHFIDITDPDNPIEIARYEVPEAGSHNFWIEDDVLYVGYYNGGVRVVDISGDLVGDLYKQGREIANFKSYDPNGYTPNAPMVWGAQPHKGHIFFSDFNSGLWAVKVEPVVPDETILINR